MSEAGATASGPVGVWNRLFFPESSPVRLAVMRIVCVGLQLIWFGESLSSQLLKLDASSFHHPQVLIETLLLVVPEATIRSEWFLASLSVVTMVAGVLALVGLLTRVTLLLFVLGTVLQITHLYSYGEHHHPEAAYCLFLLMLAFSPCGRALSVDAWIARKRGASPLKWGATARLSTAMWPIVAIQFFIALVYFDAFLSKAITGGVHWVNGYTLQTYLLQDGIRWDRPLGVFLAQSRLAGIVFAAGALVFEGLFFTVLLVKFERFRRLPGVSLLVPVFLLMGTAMHMTIWVAQAAPFFQFLVLYLTWIPWERWWQHSANDTHAEIRTQSVTAVPAA